MRPSYSSTGKQRSWLRVVSAALAVLLLLPVPGMALTFLGFWQVFTNSSGVGVPSPSITSGDNIRGGFLEVNMGEYLANGFSGSLSVTAVRDFRINGAAELVSIRRSFTSLLSDGRIRVTVNITPYNVANPPPFIIPPVNFNRTGQIFPGPPFGGPTVGDDSVNTGLFLGGNYRVTINILYEKNGQLNGQNSGYWRNLTPHRFEFFGI